MTRLVLIRHAPTPWNRAGRLQGRTDIALDAAAEAWVATWRLPEAARGLPAVTSPLARAARTAELLLRSAPPVEDRLAEMAYGDWEGERIAELRRRLGPAMAENEARGWDFQPPGGESPAMVLARVKPWLAEVAAQDAGDGAGCLAVCHNGVIRAIMGWAADWDFRGKPPAKLADGTAHIFTLSPDGRPSIKRLNLPLADVPFPAVVAREGEA